MLKFLNTPEVQLSDTVFRRDSIVIQRFFFLKLNNCMDIQQEGGFGHLTLQSMSSVSSKTASNEANRACPLSISSSSSTIAKGYANFGPNFVIEDGNGLV